MKRVLKNISVRIRGMRTCLCRKWHGNSRKGISFLNRNTVGIIDIDKLYMLAKKKHLEIEFEKIYGCRWKRRFEALG